MMISCLGAVIIALPLTFIGGFAYVIVLALKPANLSFEQAAAVPVGRRRGATD